MFFTKIAVQFALAIAVAYFFEVKRKKRYNGKRDLKGNAQNKSDLLFEHKINGKNEKDKCDNMVEPKSFCFEGNERKSGKNNQRNHFLNHF